MCQSNGLTLKCLRMCLMKMNRYPCGHCYECLSKRRSDWSIRLQEELKYRPQAYHAILTYDNEHLPMSKNGLAQVNKRDCQLFLKRLRHSFDFHISYFLAAEYGTETQRPHYHIIIFGLPLYDDVKEVGRDLYSDKLRQVIQKAWQNGFVRFQSKYVVTSAQLHYITKDIYNWLEPLDLFKTFEKLKNAKKHLRENFEKFTFNAFLAAHGRDDRAEVFRLMSKNLGIGYVENFPVNIPLHLIKKYNGAFIYMFQDGKRLKQPANFVPYGDYYVRRDVFESLEVIDGELHAPLEVECYLDDWSSLQLELQADGSSKLKTMVYAMPRYYSNKLLPPDFRPFKALKVYYKTAKWREQYVAEHKEYDSRHEVPYFIQSAQQDYKSYFKSHKDKHMQNVRENKSDLQ